MYETALNRYSEDLLPGFFPIEEKNEYLVGTTGTKVTADSSIGVINKYCTTKRKELHGTTGVRALSVGQRYSDFVLLIGTNISNEAANLDNDLYLHDKMVKASASPCGLLELDVKQMEQAKLFQALMFNGLFGNTFDGVSDKKERKFNTFVKYFEETYGIVLRHPLQPLLALKPSHRPHNLLSSKLRDEGNHVKINVGTSPVNKTDSCVHMPPELLILLNLPEDILRAFYLVPSLMHRIETLMLASQLRSEISYEDSNISSFLILEAITTLRCSENFSMEHLELLGDSVLKYAVSRHLFLKFPDKDEGQLSSSRDDIISNAALYGFGIGHTIQGYIRDAAFDPRRWLVPGQLSIHHVPCNCPVDSEVVTRDIHVVDDKPIDIIGQTCDKGHRWMCSKTIADCVEAVIGAYYVGGGLRAALAVFKWLGIDAEIEEELIIQTILSAPVMTYPPKIDVEMLEAKLGYVFSVKGFLLEALTHSSQQESAERYSYQRLEFLGDVVLDILLTWHLFNNHKYTDEGELTDLRSALGNNENFAQVAVKHKLHQFLQHSCGNLADQITKYVNSFENSSMDKIKLLSDATLSGPKVNFELLCKEAVLKLFPAVTSWRYCNRRII
ncbi:endoribonuclease Dicer homolog 3a-like [Hordeum vulgare subsp. vulgare]|uniref:endoribonuclease Dicer homolog 3a-like n=1 Tax=Hordeum vulgare subsp. vulgare TaxID=112509 RepID=UPI001D1A3938|nr:endoribonuclease Dicer homolog 3a-like [Hordeum vulgare subsp. vulgare]